MESWLGGGGRRPPHGGCTWGQSEQPAALGGKFALWYQEGEVVPRRSHRRMWLAFLGNVRGLLGNSNPLLGGQQELHLVHLIRRATYPTGSDRGAILSPPDNHRESSQHVTLDLSDRPYTTGRNTPAGSGACPHPRLVPSQSAAGRCSS